MSMGKKRKKTNK